MQQHFIVDDTFFIDRRGLVLVCRFTSEECNLIPGNTIELTTPTSQVETRAKVISVDFIRRRLPDGSFDVNCFGVTVDLPAANAKELVGARGKVTELS